MVICLPEISPNYACYVVNMVLNNPRNHGQNTYYELNPIENHGIEIVLLSHVTFTGNNFNEIKEALDDMNNIAKAVFDFIECERT